ncbi:MAG: hypothetical protein EOM05_03735 [Clostridia bacterium]|nr:hypothetical protein [Clostridia bacterium]
MFSFKTISKIESDKLFEQNAINVTDTSMAVVAVNSEDNENYGFCLFDYKDLTATILALEYSKKFHFMSEGIVKAALNYAANRGAYIAESSNMSINKELIDLGFIQNGKLLTAEIPKIMVGKCCSCNQQQN